MSTSIIPGPNVFRAVSGSLFSSPVNWSRGVVPTGSDVAMIADNCTIDISRTIGSLVVRAPFTASISGSITLRINDTINVLGHLSCSGNPNIISVARKNIINNLSPGTSTFLYSGSNPQSVAGGPYYNLTILGNAIRKTNANLITSGAVIINQFANLDLGPYDLDALSTVTVGAIGDGDGTLTKSQPGNIKVGGLLLVDTHANSVKGLNLFGNPTIELKGGILVFNPSQQSNTGAGLLSFTTNNQSIIASYGSIYFNNPILISGSITVSCSVQAVGSTFLNNTISGTGTSSILYNTSPHGLYFNYAPSFDIVSGSLNITSSAGNAVGYIFNGNGTLPYTTYQSLVIRGRGTKTIRGNTIISGSLSVLGGRLLLRDGMSPSIEVDPINPTILELSSSNFIVSGSSFIGSSGNRGTLSRAFNGSTIFIGPVTLDVSNSEGPGIDFSVSNADIEFRNGFATYDPFSKIRTGTGSWYFTTNNQNLVSNFGSVTLDSRLIISGAIALTSSFSNLVVTNIINGTEANSRFVNRGNLYFATSQSLNGSLTTGSYDFTSPTNTVVVGGDYNGTIPARFSSSFYNLGITGTGIKTLGTSSYISGSLSFGTNGYLECGNEDLIVNGNFTGVTSPTMTFSKSGSGNLKFIGPVNFNNANFKLSGNPNVEFQSGLTLQIYSYQFLSGLGQWKFSTNNQNINFGSAIGAISSSILISGPITVTHTNSSFILSGSLNGDNALSKFVNGAGSGIYVTSTTPIMSTGIFDITSSNNTIGFIMTSSYTIPYTAFSSLYYGGVGTKNLSGNIIISGGLSSTEVSDLDLLTHDCTINGSTVLINNSKLSKSGGGNIVFNGNVSFNNSTINFTGNPDVEIRNGLSMFIYDYQMISGTGTWKFTTNNQTMFFSINNTPFACNFLISGPITVTNTSTVDLIFSGSLNGDTASSKYVAGTNSTIIYRNSSQPMSTGILDVSSSLNTFTYISGSQNIRGGTYRNLTMLSGTKTLQGNVSVLGTLSTGSGATLATINLNGFTLTNP